ncbi:tellurite resistance TerB family protein [Thalassobius sp. S69A]|uniref:tellurite resistance TerB family protein n=1 Tax=unclassified Thalassovita TaxID=2619711 RepID=UPI000C4D2F4E|nr:hypothetical protein [Paracoccaceae bacterium]
MFSHLFRALKASKSNALPEPDEKLALGALLVRVAKSDRNYNVKEIQRIDRIFQRLYDLNPVEAAKMRAVCEKMEEHAPHMDVFSEMIREGVDFDDRLGALETMWEVALSDGQERPEELSVVESARTALGLSEADSLQARVAAVHTIEQVQRRAADDQ